MCCPGIIDFNGLCLNWVLYTSYPWQYSMQLAACILSGFVCIQLLERLPVVYILWCVVLLMYTLAYSYHLLHSVIGNLGRMTCKYSTPNEKPAFPALNKFAIAQTCRMIIISDYSKKTRRKTVCPKDPTYNDVKTSLFVKFHYIQYTYTYIYKTNL